MGDGLCATAAMLFTVLRRNKIIIISYFALAGAHSGWLFIQYRGKIFRLYLFLKYNGRKCSRIITFSISLLLFCSL